MDSEKLSGKSLQQLQDIEALCHDIKSGNATNEKIKLLSVKYNIIKSYKSEVRWDFLTEADMDYINHLQKLAWGILEPIYDKLTEIATEHCHQFFKRLKTAGGEVDPELYDYQIDLINWILEATIKAELPDDIYTLLISRGSGKTFSLSIVAVFIMLFWETYILHNSGSDYVITLSAPSQKQLAGFSSYITEMINTAQAEGIISKLDTEASEMNLFLSKYNVNEIHLTRTDSKSRYGIFYFRLGAESIEGIHNCLLMADESKFLSKQAINTSMLPTCGARNGVFLMLSSAGAEWSEFQDIVERNKTLDEQDHSIYGTKLIKSGSDETRDLNFNGRRMYQQHWEKMIKSNWRYANAVSRALKSEGGDRTSQSFSTQYDNLFLSKKSNSFFDMNDLKRINIFNYVDEYKYIRNNKYVIIAGWDVAVSGSDNSILTIKAIPNGQGMNRESILLKQFVMNPKRDKVTENVKAQANRVGNICIEYGVSSIAIDTTAIGNGADIYLREYIKDKPNCILRKDRIIPVNINIKTRFEILEHYYKRIQSGLEKFPIPDFGLVDDDYSRRAYGQAWGVYSDENLAIIFFTEHQRFIRQEIRNEDTGEIKIGFSQENAKFLHDDTIFGSGICSYILFEDPNVYRPVTIQNIDNTPYKANRNRRW